MIKSWIGKIHLWLGLASGIIVFIVSVTACIYVFNQEFTKLARKEAIYVTKPSVSKILSPSQLFENAQQLLGEKKIGWVNIYSKPDKSWVFFSYKGNSEATTYFNMIDHYESVYIDPYSGETTGSYNEKTDFFNIVKYLHWSLLLSTKIGQPIVGWSTLIFVVLLISGLVLWWPKSFKNGKNLFWIRWKKRTSAKRKNYDLHNVLGFYSLIFALIIALTGMVWAFKWFQAIVYVVASGTTVPPAVEIKQSVPTQVEDSKAIDIAFQQTLQKYSQAAQFRIVPPADSLAALNIYVGDKEGVYYKTHQLQFDQYSGELLNERTHNDKNFGEKLITANYDIHVGAILGIPGKILAFVVSLVCASLPVTGFFVWWNKRKTRKKPLFQ
ncbi:PepSY-associated TM helix domain-containing protein [Maribellus maritimus]|uniref:PepSY-associated TM helix domain-containing protein n=1 Tax=Maribellus maritimus TaxID=2870838 RepID=UPI001EEC9A2A|nr:PepSY-associated TM helix domain-containing protein [Maribellus maritimus]MCG6190637.1 PepSY domain-containing protein [Maribellus maritimus]